MQNYGHFYLIIFYFFCWFFCKFKFIIPIVVLKNLLPIEVLFFEIHYIQQLRILYLWKLFCPRRDWSFDEHVKRFVLTCWKALTNFYFFFQRQPMTIFGYMGGHFSLRKMIGILTKSCRSFRVISKI